MTEEKEEWVSLDKAAERIGVKKTALNYYIRKLKFETKRFDLDKNAYLAYAVFFKIKTIKDEERKRKGKQ